MIVKAHTTPRRLSHQNDAHGNNGQTTNHNDDLNGVSAPPSDNGWETDPSNEQYNSDTYSTDSEPGETVSSLSLDQASKWQSENSMRHWKPLQPQLTASTRQSPRIGQESEKQANQKRENAQTVREIIASATELPQSQAAITVSREEKTVFLKDLKERN